MKFDNNKIEATNGAKGFCPICGSELIAKCGPVKINHWAHKGIRSCDPWWENETEWHRIWKNNFFVEWQEFLLTDGQTGEKHIADVRTSNGIVLEFQHSHIDPHERSSRENFYKNMVWIIDGTRLENDYKRFLKGKEYFQKTSNRGIYFVFPKQCFPSAWLESLVPIIFDFRGVKAINDPKDVRNNLYCLFPKQIESGSLLIEMSQEFFINNTINGEWLNYVNRMNQFQKGWQYQMDRIKRQQENIMFQTYSVPARYQNGRRRF
jgi:competence protein CoiA